jgi:hypothetical protein
MKIILMYNEIEKNKILKNKLQKMPHYQSHRQMKNSRKTSHFYRKLTGKWFPASACTSNTQRGLSLPFA